MSFWAESRILYKTCLNNIKGILHLNLQSRYVCMNKIKVCVVFLIFIFYSILLQIIGVTSSLKPHQRHQPLGSWMTNDVSYGPSSQVSSVVDSQSGGRWFEFQARRKPYQSHDLLGHGKWRMLLYHNVK